MRRVKGLEERKFTVRGDFTAALNRYQYITTKTTSSYVCMQCQENPSDLCKQFVWPHHHRRDRGLIRANFIF